MLFNSYVFIFVFLPVALVVFFMLARTSHALAAAWLALMSLIFYGYWNPSYVGLLLGSIVFNYILGDWIAKARSKGNASKSGAPDLPEKAISAKTLLIAAITVNLLLLGYYKYVNFFLESVGALAGVQFSAGAVILPLGISFFTFTQIAFLVDTYQGKVKENNFLHYLLFVTYFPHLIAGPVLHHKEMMPQFAQAKTYRFSYENMNVGLTIFFIGLFKKLVLADTLAQYVAPIFNAPGSGVHLTFIEAWAGAICYALQLYFDFSGYSDMAIGLSRMFGVALPLNFHSPYKAVNIIDFWRRWHMTLSRFLRDYLYIPLGGNRKGHLRRYSNLLITMLIGGLWHGAGWTFVVWGGLHGLFLMVNHAWHALRRRLGQDVEHALSKPMHAFSVLMTFGAVTIAWVFFRAATIETASQIVIAMLGGNGFSLQSSHDLIPVAMRNGIFMMLMIAWFAPNTQQIMRQFKPALNHSLSDGNSCIVWNVRKRWMVLHAFIASFAILSISGLSEFLYFQF